MMRAFACHSVLLVAVTITGCGTSDPGDGNNAASAKSKSPGANSAKSKHDANDVTSWPPGWAGKYVNPKNPKHYYVLKKGLKADIIHPVAEFSLRDIEFVRDGTVFVLQTTDGPRQTIEVKGDTLIYSDPESQVVFKRAK